jgi:pilus assembly protein Flp/PilA
MLIKQIVQYVINLSVRLAKDCRGLTTVEYAIAGGLVGAAVIVAFTDLGTAVGNVVTGITDELNGTAVVDGGGDPAPAP